MRKKIQQVTSTTKIIPNSNELNIDMGINNTKFVRIENKLINPEIKKFIVNQNQFNNLIVNFVQQQYQEKNKLEQHISKLKNENKELKMKIEYLLRKRYRY